MFFSRAASVAAFIALLAVVHPASAQEKTAPVPVPAPAPKPETAPVPVPAPAPAQETAPAPKPETVPAPRPVPPPAMPQSRPPMPPRPMMPVTPPVKLPAGVAARVNGKNITYSELSTKLETWAGRPLLQQIVQAQVIEQEAKKNGVTVSATELKTEADKVKQEQVDRQSQSGTGMMTWRQIAARDGISDEFVNDNIRVSLLARKTFQKILEKQVPSLDGQIKVAHILIANFDAEPPKPDAKPKTPEEEAKRDADAKVKADQVLADILAKKISFEDAAKQYSADKGPNGEGSAAQGGALPYTG